MANYPAPPTYADVVVIDETTQRARFNPIWLKWFIDLASTLESAGAAGGSIDHESLSGLLGGGAGGHYHLTSTQQTDLTAGFTGTGKLVRETSPTLVTPTLGAAGATSLDIAGNLLAKTTAALNNGAAAAVGTLNNAPAAGNPTKWVPINDNGTVRYIPAW